MNSAELQQRLIQPYNRVQWLDTLGKIMPRTEVFASPQNIRFENTCAKSVFQLGKVHLANNHHLAVLEATVGDGVDLLRNRVGLRNVVTRYIDQAEYHGILVTFHQQSAVDYRFTFAAREAALNESGQLISRETTPRRYTYLLGPNEPCRTAALRLAGLGAGHAETKLTDVIDAFSVEKLNKEFFETYRQHYQNFCGHLLDNDNATTKIFGLKLRGLDDKARDHALKPVRDFVKKLLGRLVFLHFLQKKGWLGCSAATKNWKNGDANFIYRLFTNAPEADRKRFHSRRLVPLFFDTLNRERKDDLFAVNGSRVPYLNGGLFERDFDGVEQIDFPPKLFANLLEFFGQYNFTIDENDPDDHEIGIDPEMLGHIFENLLEDNKDKGAYYTPKAIVQYMCQQSLIYTLAGHFPDDAAARTEIENLIRHKEPIDPKQENSWLAANARALEKILDDLNICDPAIGSGAFPIGLLQEIYWTKLTLHPALDRAEAKRAIIQRSIHGVDIDAGAVEIARLRFWLALIVEEKNPVPLPNLDYQIMQGNSLLESFEGTDLSKISAPLRMGMTLLGNDQAELGLVRPVELALRHEPQEKLETLQRKYFVCHDPEEKARLRTQIDTAILQAIDCHLEYRRDELEVSLQQQALYIGHRAPTAAETKKRTAMQAELSALTNKKNKLHTLLENPRAERPFFLWHLWFRHILNEPPVGRGGFDIVIGNPPYIQLQNDQGALATEYQDSNFETFARMGDIYTLFYEHGRQLLRDGGHLCYITSNKWMRAGYGEKLRAFLATKTQPKILIDFAGQKIFESATVDTNILLFERRADTHASPALACIATEKCRENLSVFVKQHATVQTFKGAESWVILSPIERSIKQKIERIGTPLKDWDISINYGIKTGFNDAFIVNKQKCAEILDACKDAAERKRTDELLRPILRGRDIKRYSYEWANLYIIATFPALHIDIEKYPAVKKYLLSFGIERLEQTGKTHVVNGEKISARKKTGNKWFETQDQIGYWDDFSKPKIVWGNLALSAQFASAPEGMYVNAPCPMIVPFNGYLLAILNSKLGDWYIRQLGVTRNGGYFEYKPMFIEQLPVPIISAKEQVVYSTLVQKVTEANQCAIDEKVYALFKLSAEEANFIEHYGSFS